MKFLKKFFNRSSKDDEEDDFDDEDFDLEDDDDSITTTVIMDDDEDHQDGGELDDHGGDDGPSIHDQQLAALEAQMAEDDDSLFGTGSHVEGDDDDDGPVMGQDEYDVEVDDSELDYDDADWDDEGAEGEGGGKGERRKKLIFAAIAAGVLILGIVGGAAFWLMGDVAEVAEAPPDDGRILMALPPKQGSLNAVQDQAGDRPAPNPDAPSGLAASEQAAPGQAPPAGETAAPETAAPAGGVQNSVLTTPEAAGGSLNALAGATSGAQGIVVPSVTSVSYQRTADIERNVPLATAPIQSLLETVSGQAKPLPKIDAQGRKPWEAYARPLTGNEQGQHVGILITGLGLSRAATLATIRKLPPEVSLVFEPYASDLEDWLLRSRLAGHEAYVALPMESQGFPSMDAGPMALTTTVQVAENINRLRGVLSSFAGYVGVVSSMGSKFATADGQLKPVLEEIKRRGLIYIDAAATSKSSAATIAQEIDLPVLKSNVVLDDPPSSSNIQRRLRTFESFVSKNATGIAMAHPYPVSIHQIQAWINTLPGKKLALVPVSSIVGKQFIE